MHPVRIFLSALACVGLAAACAGGAVSVQTEIGRAYDLSNFGAYHAGRDTRVDVMGSTFGMAPRNFADAVTAGMQGHNSGGRTNFTATPGPSAAPGMRVVMAFDTVPAASTICEAASLAPAKDPGVTLQAAWCFDGRVDSYVIARTGPVKGPEDPAFRALVAQATRDLFPTVRDHKINEITDDN
ncbi:MAG: hypothetical protein RL477_822 [Pseudomonadota bacterium]|jgi:hypothetical protein